MVQFNCHDLKIALIFLQFAYWRGVALHAWPAPADPTLTASFLIADYFASQKK
jgi:hypothetical protein